MTANEYIKAYKAKNYLVRRSREVNHSGFQLRRDDLIPWKSDVADTLGDCWAWIWGTSKSGHPTIKIDDKAYMIARLVANTPEDHYVHRLCGVVQCLNPEHLVNIPDRIAKVDAPDYLNELDGKAPDA